MENEHNNEYDLVLDEKIDGLAFITDTVSFEELMERVKERGGEPLFFQSHKTIGYINLSSYGHIGITILRRRTIDENLEKGDFWGWDIEIKNIEKLFQEKNLVKDLEHINILELSPQLRGLMHR